MLCGQRHDLGTILDVFLALLACTDITNAEFVTITNEADLYRRLQICVSVLHPLR